MNRRSFSNALVAAAAAPFLALDAALAAAPIQNVVLVHGAYADASSWSDVIGCGLAAQTLVVRGFAIGSHDRSRSRALHGAAHERDDD